MYRGIFIYGTQQKEATVFFSAHGAGEFPAVADGGESGGPKERSSQICLMFFYEHREGRGKGGEGGG